MGRAIMKNVESRNIIEDGLCVKELVGFCTFKAALTCIQQLKALAVCGGSVQLDEDVSRSACARQVVRDGRDGILHALARTNSVAAVVAAGNAIAPVLGCRDISPCARILPGT